MVAWQVVAVKVSRVGGKGMKHSIVGGREKLLVRAWWASQPAKKNWSEM